MQNYQADKNRYEKDMYRFCGKSGLALPKISLGLWHNFGYENNFENARKLLRTAFDNGITHFDLANNYGPPYGSAEENFGRLFAQDFKPYRDELIISTKAGYDMWEGPYGNWGSKKYLVASLDQSLKRMGLDYIDIFYHHRPDPNTPLEETMGALDLIVRQGKALYVGISNYPVKLAAEAFAILKRLGTPCIIHQFRYNILDREAVSDDFLEVLFDNGVGGIVFSPLAQGVLTDKYLNGLPPDSRAVKDGRYLQETQINIVLKKVTVLNQLALENGWTLAQMSLCWLLSQRSIVSVLVGASKPTQLVENLKAVENRSFNADTLEKIEKISTK